MPQDDGHPHADENSGALVDVPESAAQQAEAPHNSVPVGAAEAKPQLVMLRGNTRRDRGRLHAVRHGVLARNPLEALRYLGEDVKRLRALERQFRTELRPQGAIADLFFDRFWSSYLRCLLAARVEAAAFIGPGIDNETAAAPTPKLVEADQPILVFDEPEGAFHHALTPDVLHQLALVQRYDGHFGREMYRALGVLLLLRSNGESGLEESIAVMMGKGTSPFQ